jgi:hypothetical protein
VIAAKCLAWVAARSYASETPYRRIPAGFKGPLLACPSQPNYRRWRGFMEDEHGRPLDFAKLPTTVSLVVPDEQHDAHSAPRIDALNVFAAVLHDQGLLECFRPICAPLPTCSAVASRWSSCLQCVEIG